MSTKNTSSKSLPNSILQDTLNSALLLTEVGVDLRGCYVSGSKCLSQLKNIITTTEGAIEALQLTAKSTLEHAHKIVVSINNSKPTKEGQELITIIDKQLSELNTTGNRMVDDTQQMKEKVRIEKRCGSPTTSWTNKSIKSDVNEKYPENLSRESLIDLNSIANLPPVPEDIFTSFSTKPMRSSSLSSLKSMRKVKMFLQKAESSDEEDISDNEEPDFAKISIGDAKDSFDDGDDRKPLTPISKKLLCDITEETKVED
ncbi:uncharacterized protein LOC130895422 [Diorhabda carinulata]|uniref:uncharacterized protein LOC130895422 n=1 Tax=Diorhabda carinulata TaxID=1163345 RepID=UPI0025A212EA|nr:uncharacterized protein LOC130895422 [Diorhabda carinulata]